MTLYFQLYVLWTGLVPSVHTLKLATTTTTTTTSTTKRGFLWRLQNDIKQNSMNCSVSLLRIKKKIFHEFSFLSGSRTCPHFQGGCKNQSLIQPPWFLPKHPPTHPAWSVTAESVCTHKWNVSLYLGDQLLDLDLVECLRFLSLRCGPIRCTSTRGQNMPVVCHFSPLAATTDQHTQTGPVKTRHAGKIHVDKCVTKDRQ